ncbi:MAG: PHP domain-containing protein [Spirochaetales bacterium]|nr:PHP domain-containing protein [Spirochaetales bacterium]
MLVTCDFHNHSCLSPCGSLDQPPSVLARLACARGLNLVALTDHNSALNTPAFAECARREGISALYGMEATSREEVHVLCLFAEPQAALEFGKFLLERLSPTPRGLVRPDEQVVVDADDNVIEQYGVYLGMALTLDYDDLCAEADSWGALVIPAHIDRPAFGAISHLGFLPEGPYAAVEAVRPLPVGASRGYTVITGSDAHYPEHIARRPFRLELPDTWNARSTIDLAMIRAALGSGRVLLPFDS